MKKLQLAQMATLGAGLTLAVSACASAGSGATSSGAKPPQVVRAADTTPAASVTYAERMQARFTVEDADGLTAVGGALWVKTDPGHVVRIDPTTNKITDDIVVDRRPTRSAYCQGIGTDGASPWACATRHDGTGIAQIDPHTDRIMRVVQTDKVFDQLAIPSTSRGLWVLSAGGSKLTVVDPASGRASSYPLPVHCTQVAAHGDLVVCTDSVAKKVVAIDGVTGKVVATSTLNAPRITTITDQDVWVDTDDGLTRLTRNLDAESVYPGMAAGLSGDLFSADGVVWLREPDGTIFRIDAVTGQVLERIMPAHPVSAGSLIVAYGSIWTSLSEEGKVIRLRLNG